MDEPITCETEADTFLATTPVKPQGSEKRKYTEQELKEMGDKLDSALETPMPEGFFAPSSDAFFGPEINEKIEVWQKNAQALLDIVGLLYILKTGGAGTVGGDALFVRVLQNLQDSEITVGYKGESLHKKNGELYKEIDAIAEQYSEVVPDVSIYFKNVRSLNIDEYLFNSRMIDEQGNAIRWYDEPYNLIASLIASGSIKWMRELLLSNIDSECRLVMLDEIIKSNKVNFWDLVADSDYPDSVYPAAWDNEAYEENKKQSIDQMMDLIKMWAKKNVLTDDNKYEMLMNMKFENLKFLQTEGIIDFVRDITYTSEYGEVAVPVQIYARSRNGVYEFGPFYDTESYQKLPENIKQNTDRYLIHGVIEENEPDRLISRKNFPITDENVQAIISALSSLSDGVYEWQLKAVCNAIEKRATTPKEYRRVKQYIKQIWDSLDPSKLEQQRQELVVRLFNMHKSLEEQVPGKMKIKDIKFKVGNK